MTVMNTIARSGLATARDLRAAMEGRSRRSATTPMFSTFLEKWRIGADQAPLFVYCLKRHIEVASDQHGPAAKAILAAATAGDPLRGLQVLNAARQSIEARIRLWDGLLTMRGSKLARQRRRPAPLLPHQPALRVNLHHRGGQSNLCEWPRSEEPQADRGNGGDIAKGTPRNFEEEAMMKFVIAACLALPLTYGTAQSEPLKSATAVTAVVGNLSIISYFTRETDGLHVISTARVGDADYAPVFRVTSVLLPNQEVVISVPQSLGSRPLELRLVREGDTIRQVLP